jgi:hypothetical protein
MILSQHLPSQTAALTTTPAHLTGLFRAGGSNFHVVRPSLIGVLGMGSDMRKHAKLVGSGGMLPQENFVICTLGDCLWWLLRPVLTRLLINLSDFKIHKFTARFTTIQVSMKALREAESLMKKTSLHNSSYS